MTADPTPTASVSSLSSGRHPLGTVYLFHFDQRYEHAGHYTGWAEDLDHRVAEHLAGRGARLIEVITQAGIDFRLARTWPGVTRARERQLKRQGGASRYCPICQDDRKARGIPRRPARDQQASPPPPREQITQRSGRWVAAVPTRGTRPDRVQAFLELNPGFARPARASQAKQWGGARSREEVELLGPRVTSAAWDENAQPSQHRVATVTRRAVQARLQARQQRTAARAEQTRTRELAARTHQRLLARQRQAAGSRPQRTREERDREAELSPDDHFYEWLLSDHPAAASERARRRLDHQLAEAIDLERLRGWLAKIDRLGKDGRPLGDSVRRLAEQARTRLIPNAEQRLVALTNTSDQVRVHRARQEFETSLQVGRDPDYRYPSRYLGTQAADQPIPPEPWARPHDPEEVPTLSDRTVRDLDAENSHSGFVRIRAITHRTRLALERGDRNRPARQPEDAPPLRARRGRGDRPEPDRER